MATSDKLGRLPPYLFAELEKKVTALRNKGVDVINLSIGDPDQPPPERALELLKSTLKDNGVFNYSPSSGTEEFRKSVAAYFKNRFEVSLDWATDVCLGVGSKELIGHFPLSFTNPGDVVLMPQPGYPPYFSGTIFGLCEPYIMPLKRENGFLPDLDAIPEDVYCRTKIMFINYPNNPTGAVASIEFYNRVVERANKFGFIVVSDEAYVEMTHRAKPLTFLQANGAKEVGVAVHSATKTFNMAGFRVAWIVGNPQIVQTVRGFKANLDSGQFVGFQKVVGKMLNEYFADAEAIKEMYRERIRVFIGGLKSLGWKVEEPPATFYIWFPVPDGSPSFDYVNRVIEKCGVVFTPGAGFGKHGEGFIRVSLTADVKRLNEAIARLKSAKL